MTKKIVILLLTFVLISTISIPIFEVYATENNNIDSEQEKENILNEDSAKEEETTIKEENITIKESETIENSKTEEAVETENKQTEEFKTEEIKKEENAELEKPQYPGIELEGSGWLDESQIKPPQPPRKNAMRASAIINTVNDVNTIRWADSEDMLRAATYGGQPMYVPNDSPMSLNPRQITHINGYAKSAVESADVQFTNIMFCMEPGVNAPDEGYDYNVSVRITSSATGGLAKIRKLMYYAYGSPGWNSTTYNRWYAPVSGTLETHPMLISHFTLAHAFFTANNVPYAVKDGTDPLTFEDNIGKYDYNVAMNWFNDVNNLPDPPSNFSALIVQTSEKQDLICGVTINEKVDIKINKQISNTNISNGNSLYTTNGTRFSIYRTQADARSGSNAVASFTINGTASETRTLTKGTYYLVETSVPSGLLIPNHLKASSGGYQINLTSSGTLNL